MKHYLNEKHWQELRSSSIDSTIAALNFRSVLGDEAYSYLIPDIVAASGKVHPDAQWRWARSRYSHIEAGGWWCGTIDPRTLEVSHWGCLKPDTPRRDANKLGKFVKYEHPPKTPTEVFCLNLPLHIWQRVVERWGAVVTCGNKEQINTPQVTTADGMVVTPGNKEKACGYEFWAWVLAHPEIPIIITEGAKKAAAILTAGYVVIALPGITGGYRTPQDDQGRVAGMRYLIDQLKVFAAQGRPIYFAFDQDTKHETRLAVANAIERTGDLLVRDGCRVHVMEWQGAKGADDLIATLGVAAFDAAYNSALSLDAWKVARLGELTYPADIEINQRYLGELVIPENAKLIGIKAAKGTGKTESLMGEVETAHAQGQRVLVLTHRIQLGEALCNRFGIPYVTEVKSSETGDLLGYGLCIDSLHAQSLAQFNPNDWHNAILIIDEAEQVIWHALNACTEVKKHRVKVLRNLKILVQNILSSKAGRIYLADADLSDIAINYIKSLAGFHIEPFIIRNDWQPSAGTAHIYPGTDPRALVAALEKEISNGGKVFVCCSSQKSKSKWGTKNLEYRLRKRFPNKRILRIDSETVADPKHPAYGVIALLNQILPQYDIVLASPSIETGVSIDIRGHFTSVWNIAQGVQPENSVRQALARLREPVERHVWAASVGLRSLQIGNGAITPGALLRGQQSQIKANIALLTAADCHEEFQIDVNFQPESLWTWAKRACIINSGMWRYREAIIEGLIADGYQINFVNPDDDGTKELVKEMTVIRDLVYQEECKAIAECELPSPSQLQALKEKRTKTTSERYQERKADLAERYGVEVTPELVALDDNGWYAKLRLYYFLTIGNAFLNFRDLRMLKAHVEAGDGAVWKPDFNKGQLLAPVKLLEELGILGLLQPGKEWKGSDPEVEEIANLAKDNKQIIKNYLGLTISDKDTPIALIQRLLGKLGLKLTFVRKVGGRGKQQRVYAFESPTDGREEVLQQWLQRDESAMVLNAA